MTVALEQVVRLLPALSAADKQELLRHVAQAMGSEFPGIEAEAAVCGGAPRVIRTRIPVWVLEQARRLGLTESQLLADYPTLRPQDLANAWTFAGVHQEDMDRQILENESA